jgi:cytochrome P450
MGTVASVEMAKTFDPFDAEQVQAAWPLLEELRRETPVADLEDGMRYVTRFDECRAVLRDTTALSNARGFKAQGVVVPPEDRILGEMDPPQHTAVRRVMVTALTPKVVHAAEGFIEATAQRLLAQVPDRGRTDLVPALTVPLPNRATVHLLGFPPDDADTIAAWAKELMESGFPATNRSARGEGFANAFPEFAGYIDDRIAQRAAQLDAGRDEHPDEVLTRLIKLEVDGEHLAPRQLRALVRNLITGGLTTTSQLLGNLIHDALSVPGLEAALRESTAALDTAIEESLRLRPPVMFVVRGCVADMEIGGCPVHDGERVIVGTASANRDERNFDTPDAFRVDRHNADQHLTFGYGPHVCPGATLARAVTRIGLRILFTRFPPGTVRLAADHVYENVPTFFECGPRHLAVETNL